MNQQVHFKENLYFVVKIFITIIFYVSLIMVTRNIAFKKIAPFAPLMFYCLIFIFYLFIRHGILIGFLKGNAVRVSESQFQDVYALAKNQSEQLGMDTMPAIYIMQAGGLLNAFATRFFGKDFVVIYSDILEAAQGQSNNALAFIIAHELGHIKRRHSTKHILLFPSTFVPFLNQAYSRACEYTCDKIGYSLCPEGSIPGMLILAAGKHLHSKINVDEFLLNSQKERGFWRWFAEIVSSHPNLAKRISEFRSLSTSGFHS